MFFVTTSGYRLYRRVVYLRKRRTSVLFHLSTGRSLSPSWPVQAPHPTFHFQLFRGEHGFREMRVPNTIESGLTIRFNLAMCSFRVRFSMPPSLAYADTYTSISYSGTSRVSVAGYYRKHVWPREWGIPGLERVIH